MTLRLNGSTSGYTEIDAPATAGNNNLKLPTGNGSDGNILGTDGAGNLNWVNGRMVLDTAKASTSGTSVDFTGIPSWVKRVTVMFSGVSTNGSSNWLLQLGAGSVTTSGYATLGSNYTATPVITQTTSTNGFLVIAGAATVVMTGAIRFHLVTGNTWIGDGFLIRTDTAISNTSGGSVTLSAPLDRLRITTVNGTDTFDAGSINILYEG